jgi:DNA-binding Lrp family transcriptional regulator
MGQPRDERDRQILDLLKADAWQTYAALAERVNLSASAVQRRVERLVADGVILGAHAQVAAEPNPQLTIYMMAELSDDATTTITRFSETLRDAPEVIEAHYIAGDADVILRLAVKDMAHYDRFVATHLNAQPLVRRFSSFVALRPLL